MSNLATRILTGVIAGSALIGLVVFVPDGHGFLGVCALISIVGVLEFLRIIGTESTVDKVVAVVLAAGLWAATWFYFIDNYDSVRIALSAVAVIFPLFAIIRLFSSGKYKPQPGMLSVVVSMLYVVLPFVLFYLLSGFASNENAFEYEWRLPMGIFILTWTSDTFAYFGGRAFGKNKLFERISPKKTWEGAISGTVACIGAGFLLDAIWELDFGFWQLSIMIAVLTPIGDLVESMMKRSLEIKDSGGILPGHGGVLDRFDGPLISVPILFAYFYILTHF